jgi:hypothetical protein
VSIELLVNTTPLETRVALLEGGVLQELFIERASRRGLVGNLYKGRITRVLPGMQAAFVELGLARSAFLHADDIVLDDARRDALGIASGDGSDGSASRPEIDIRRLVDPGDDLLVQVVKDPLGTKGARLTTFVTLPSRYLVFMPRGRGIGISSRIEDETERARLRAMVQALVADGHPGGYILRTAAEGVEAAELAVDLEYLERLWRQVRERHLRATPGSLVHEDLPLARRVLRDELARGVEQVWVDDAAELGELRQFVGELLPDGAPILDLHTAVRPLFDVFGVEAEIVSYEWAEYLKLSKDVNRDGALLLGWTGDNGDPDNFLAVLLSCAGVGGNNRAQWCNKEFDELVNKAKIVSDQAERTKLYEQAQVVFKQEAPWATIAHSVVFMPMSKKVTGYKMDPLGSHRFDGVDISE